MLFQKAFKGFACKINGPTLVAVPSPAQWWLVRLAQTQGVSMCAAVADGNKLACFRKTELPLLLFWLGSCIKLLSIRFQCSVIFGLSQLFFCGQSNLTDMFKTARLSMIQRFFEQSAAENSPCLCSWLVWDLRVCLKGFVWDSHFFRIGKVSFVAHVFQVFVFNNSGYLFLTIQEITLPVGKPRGSAIAIVTDHQPG